MWFMRPKIDTTDAMTWLNWLVPGGPWTLVACKGHDPIEARLCSAADAPSFLASHTQRGRIVRVLLGQPAPGWRTSKDAPPIVQSRYVGLATSIARFKELDEAARPSIWITAQDHAIAVWRLSLPISGDESLAAIRKFGAEFGGKILPDMIPVPDLGNGFARHSFRFDRDAIVWRGQLQFSRGPQKAAPTATQQRKLEETLRQFKIGATVTGMHVGPVVTLLDVKLAPGTKASQVVTIAKDIARDMGCTSARINEATGDGTIGIELPNKKRETVTWRQMIESDAFQNTKAALPIALGKAIDGTPTVVDLATMPHVLIAGTTGSGKSVGMNAMIMSLILKLSPVDVNFVMIDPKELELAPYARIPHMLAPVITEPQKAVIALTWVVSEMERRYKRLAGAGVRDLASFNAKRPGERMARIVVVIDEFADLMMTSEKEVEHAVQRLSQKARAAGIHIIMATQRPSVDVVTGVIKANMPARISFYLKSRHDSDTILGLPDATQLLGQGDMLYLSSKGDYGRYHGPFVSDDDVEAATRRLSGGNAPVYDEGLMSSLDGEDGPTFDSDRRTTRMDAALDVYATLTGPMQNAVRFLMTFFQSRLPATTDRIFEAGAPHGIRDGGTFYRACKMLQIESRSNGSNKPATLIPPAEWPLGFESVPVAMMA
jgi:hypothetical protein